MTRKPAPSKAQSGVSSLLGQLRDLIRQARQQALRAVDLVQVRTSWEVGRPIVEFEQGGRKRASYGAGLLASKDHKRIAREVKKNLAQMDEAPRDFVRDPVMLEFLGMPDTGRLLESKLEVKLMELVTKLGRDVKIVVGPVRRRTGKPVPALVLEASIERGVAV